MEGQIVDPRIGSVLQERYLIQDRVAEGGMGTVYKGERVQLGRPVAIKFLHPWMAAQEAFIRRFELEARAMSRLAHPNCVSVIDFGVEGAPYVVMEFVTGRTLRQAMDAGRMTVPRALHIGRQILAGLAHAHAQGIVHRDIKPDNIILSDTAGLEDHVRILDFGLAKLADGGQGLTAGLAVGTPSYMAPEQTGGTDPVDGRADVYAAGVVLFELLAGRKPFVSEHVGEIIRMHREAPPPPLRRAVPEAGFSAELEAVVLRALAKSPTDRYPSAVALGAALDGVPEASATATARPALALTVAAPAAVPRPAPPAERTIADPTLIEMTGSGQPAAAPAKPTAIRRLRPFLVAARRGWRWLRSDHRRMGIAGAVALAVLAVTVGIAVRGRPPAEPPPPVPVAAPPTRPTAVPRPNELAEAESLAESGQRDRAIAVLVRARRDSPADDAASALLARLYFEKLWWSEGVAAFRAAIQADPARRGDPVLIRHVIHSLVSDRFADTGVAFLRELGAPARPFVEEAARHHDSPGVRARAARLVESWR